MCYTACYMTTKILTIRAYTRLLQGYCARRDTNRIAYHTLHTQIDGIDSILVAYRRFIAILSKRDEAGRRAKCHGGDGL